MCRACEHSCQREVAAGQALRRRQTPQRMRHHREKSEFGFALAYAMLVTTVFLVFFAALVVSARNTMLAVQHDEQLVKARLIAAAGNELVFHLLSNREDDWYEEDFSFSNDPEADDYFAGMRDTELEEKYSPQVLGGTFRVRTQTWESDEDELSGGTYLVLICSAKVGRRETTVDSSSRFLVKVSNPFVNNLTVGQGYLPITAASTLSGPVLVTSGGGLPGQVDLVAHTVTSAAVVPRSIHSRTVNASINVRSQGDIRLVNTEQGAGIIESQILSKGTYAPGQFELLPPPAIPGATLLNGGIGGVLFSQESILQPNAQLLPRLPKAQEIFQTLSRLSGTENIDITSHSRGVLLEIDGDRATLHEMVPTTLGRLFDLGMLVSLWEQPFDYQELLVNRLQSLYGAGAYGVALKAVEWDDPSFPNAALPLNLREHALSQYQVSNPDARLTDIPTTGDYFELLAPRRGALLAEWNLSRDSWKVLHFSTSSLSGSDDDGNPVAPPIFVRGRVQGKVLLAYDVAENLLPLDLETHTGLCDVIVLSEGDTSTGIEGGLRLEDESVLRKHNSTETPSLDQCLVLSRGGVKSWGPPLQMMSWVTAPDQSRINALAAALPSLTPEETTVMNEKYFMRPATFYGVSCGDVLNLNQASMTANLRQAIPSETLPSRFPEAAFQRPIVWTDLDPSNSRDTRLLGGNQALIPWAFRLCYRPWASTWITHGAHSSLRRHNTTPLFGQNTYDYRWRSLDAATLREHMGLPVTLTLIDRQGE